MLVIPSIDVEGGRSRVVYWPGAAAGEGAPTDRPERIARAFVEMGAPLVHLVDLDGARAGAPANLEVVGRVATEVAVPLQLAGGVDGPDQIRLAFAAGATRVVMPLQSVADRDDRLRESLEVGGSWVAVGLDARTERFREFPWRGEPPRSLDDLVARLAGAGVERFVLSHGGAAPDVVVLSRLVARSDAEFLVAGGVTDVDELRRLRDAGVAGVILGQALLSGQLDYREAAAAGG